MANEITLSSSLLVEKGTLKEEFRPGSIRADLTGSTYEAGTTVIGTGVSGQQLTSGLITNGGMVYVRNTGDDYTIDIGRSISSTFQAFISLMPGEFAVFRNDSSNLYAKAITGSSNLQWAVFAP